MIYCHQHRKINAPPKEKMSQPSYAEESAEIWSLFKETDARLDRRFQETDDKLRRLEGMVGIQWGRMLEALVRPAALKLFQDRSIDVHYTYQRLKSSANGRNMEVDVVLENDDEVVVIEVKSLVRIQDVDDNDRQFQPRDFGLVA